MFFSGIGIKELLSVGRIAISPVDAGSFRRGSYALHLAGRTRVWRHVDSIVDVMAENALDGLLDDVTEADYIDLRPGIMVLAQTQESIALDKGLVGILSNFSHFARLGIAIDFGASWIAPGSGLPNPQPITLELISHNPNILRLPAGTPICHLRVADIQEPPAGDLVTQSLYQGRDPLTRPMLFEDFSAGDYVRE